MMPLPPVTLDTSGWERFEVTQMEHNYKGEFELIIKLFLTLSAYR